MDSKPLPLDLQISLLEARLEIGKTENAKLRAELKECYAGISRGIPVVEERDRLLLQVDQLQKERDCFKGNYGRALERAEEFGIRIDELNATIEAEKLRARMLNTVHQVALNQNTAMLELAEHYTGSLWPEEVQRAAKEIILAAQMAKNEKRICKCGATEPPCLCRELGTQKRYCECPASQSKAITVNGCCPGCKLPIK